MSRPNLKDVRSREILDAFVNCVARYGLEGATQERIAAEAGVKRTLLRHYLGNRDAMIAALAAHVVGEFRLMTEAMEYVLRDSDGIDDVINLFFDPASKTDPRLLLVFQALVAAVESYPDMRLPLLGSMERFYGVLTLEVCKHYSAHGPEICEATAHGLAAIYFSLDALTPLAPPSNWRRAARIAAENLVRPLEGPST